MPLQNSLLSPIGFRAVRAELDPVTAQASLERLEPSAGVQAWHIPLDRSRSHRNTSTGHRSRRNMESVRRGAGDFSRMRRFLGQSVDR